MAEEKIPEETVDSSMSTPGGKLCTDSECVGQVDNDTDKEAGQEGRGSRKEEENTSSMRAGKDHCVDDQCIGKG